MEIPLGETAPPAPLCIYPFNVIQHWLKEGGLPKSTPVSCLSTSESSQNENSCERTVVTTSDTLIINTMPNLNQISSLSNKIPVQSRLFLLSPLQPFSEAAK